MANSEACQLFIEQSIDEGLEEGKTPYSIGKELSKWIEKVFKTKIKPTTLEKKAERRKNPTNVGSDSTPEDTSEIPKTIGGQKRNSNAQKNKPDARWVIMEEQLRDLSKSFVDIQQKVQGVFALMFDLGIKSLNGEEASLMKLDMDDMIDSMGQLLSLFGINLSKEEIQNDIQQRLLEIKNA